MSKKKAIIVVSIAMLSLLCASRCYAGGWSGNGNLPSPSSNGWGLSGGNHNVFWFHYNYIGGKNWAGKPINIVTQYNSTTYPEISGECASAGVGFWVLSLATDGQHKESDGSFRNETALDGYSDYPITVDGVKNYYKNKKCDSCKSYTVDAVGGSTTFWGKAYAPYHTLSLNNATGNQSANYSLKGATLAGQILYANDIPVYENDRIAGSFSEIAKAYRLYTRRDNKATDLGDNVSDDDVANIMSNNNTYAFCSYPDEVHADLESQTKITATASDTSEGSSDKTSGWNDVNAVNNNVLVIHSSSSIALKSQYKTKRNRADFASNAVANAVTSTLSADLSHHQLPSTGKFDLPTFGNGVSEVGFQNGQSITINASTLAIGEVYTFCASHSQPGKITVSSSNVSTSGASQSKACVKVKYVPITATIDSDTRATLDGKNYDSGADASKTYPDENNYISVNAGPKTVTWSHYLGWTGRSDNKTTGNVLAKTYGLNGAKALGNALSVGKYNNTHTFNLNKNNNGYPDTSGNNYNTSEAGVFPGELRNDISQSLKHPSKVNVTSGDAAAGSSDESSSVKLRLKADNIQCGLKKGDYGLDKDLLYPIGANAPNDYRWLIIQRDNNTAISAARAIAGDGVADSDNLWLTEDNKIFISQIACFGSQIGIDASNKSSDRFSRNMWANSTVDYREPDTVHNRQFALTSDFSDTFFMAKSASGVSSHTNRSLRASEIGITDDFSKVSTPKSRITNNYKIEAKTGLTSVNGYLGRSFNTSFSKPGPNGGTSGAAVTVSVKIPYNYYLTVDPGDSETLDGATNASFTVTINNNGRVNKQVCSGRDKGSDCAAYPTRTKKTTANMVVFALDSNFDVSALSNHRDFTMQGNMTSVDNIKSVIGQRLGSYNPESLKEAPNGFSNTVIGASGTKTLRAGGIDYSNYPVGTKICAATAVYPSDSHDTGISTGPNAYVVDSAEQSNALRENGQLTRYNVTCRTVAKHQTMSVEGNGLATKGNINTNSTVYKGRVFRSWSEYQIVSSSSNAGSGAVTAYALNNAVTDAYATKDNVDQYSVEKGSFLYPQSLGNIRQLNFFGSNSKDEATTNWGYAEKLKNTIIDKYGNSSDTLSDEYYRSNSEGNIEITPQGCGKETIIIRTTGKATITANSRLDDSNAWGNPKQIIIIANSIDIAGDVEKVNAWLIVDRGEFIDGGEFNTCAGNQPDYKKPGTNEGDGNQHLLDNCNRPLFINGAVIVDGTVTLPRTYGGGSVVNADGSITKDERTYALRAEIFNYDPRVVKWAYEESKKNPQLVTTYTESIAPRL